MNKSFHTGTGPEDRRPGQPTHLRGFWHFVLRNHLLTIGIPVLTVAATVVFVQIVAPTYQASSWLRIEPEQPNIAAVNPAQQLTRPAQIFTEMEVLRRRPLAEAVVDSLALQVRVLDPLTTPRSALFDAITVSRDAPKGTYRFGTVENGGTRFTVTAEETGDTVDVAGIGETVRLPGATLRLASGAADHETIEVLVEEFGEAVEDFRNTVRISRPNRDADILAIFYEGHDPELVRDIPNVYAGVFIGWRREVNTTEARSTVDFLGDQIAALGEQLRAAEGEMLDFRERAGLVDLEVEAQTQLQRLATLQAERDRLNAEREALDTLLAQVTAAAAETDTLRDESPYRDLIAFPTLLQNFAVSELFRTMGDLENERAELLNRRTPRDPDVQVLTRRIRDLEDQLHNIALTYLGGLSNQVASLNEMLAGFERELNLVPEREIEFLRLEREATVLQEIYTLLQTRLKEAEVRAAVDDAAIRVVEPAILPHEPIAPNKTLSVFLAMVLGTVLGVGAAFARESMDNTIRTREDLQALLGEAPVLGLIPRIADAAVGELRRKLRPGQDGGAVRERLVTDRDPRSPVSEAYRSLRTNLTFARPDAPPASLVFTSPTPGDGKSTTAANLAITLVQQGVRCILIDADMRRGLLNEVFGREREPGLSNAILRQREVADVVQSIAINGDGRLDLMPTGTLPPNPAELLGGRAMHELLERLNAEYEMVLLDAPPLNLVTDAAVLGTFTDGVVLVARSGVTEAGAVAYALEQLRTVRAPLLGAVLNDVDTKRNRYYGSYGAGAHEDYYGSTG
ncbi:MAG: GumC family protein [Gemmatimonadota bacterium]